MIEAPGGGATEISGNLFGQRGGGGRRDKVPPPFIIGSGDVGISAPLRCWEVNPAWDVTGAVADSGRNYSVCGLPF